MGAYEFLYMSECGIFLLHLIMAIFVLKEKYCLLSFLLHGIKIWQKQDKTILGSDR